MLGLESSCYSAQLIEVEIYCNLDLRGCVYRWIILQGEGGVTKKTGKFGFKGGGWGVIEKKSNILNLGIPKSQGVGLNFSKMS